MAGIIGITGTPGTGKKSIAPRVAKNLGRTLHSVEALARAYGLTEQSGEETLVDTAKLRRKLHGWPPSPALVFGHLLPQVLDPGAVERVVVLRCDPAVLRRRLELRGYPREKVQENVEAELIGLVSSEAYEAFGEAKTRELDTTRCTPADAAADVAALLDRWARALPRVDWTLSYDSGRKLRSLLSPG